MDKDKPRNSEERNKLIKEELNNPEGFIWSVIKKKGYGNAIESWNFMDKDDLIQEGWIALLQAGDNYDKGFNKDFAWYAFYWVNQRLGRIVDENIDKERHETSWEKNYEIEDVKEFLLEREKEGKLDIYYYPDRPDSIKEFEAPLNDIVNSIKEGEKLDRLEEEYPIRVKEMKEWISMRKEIDNQD